MGHRDGRFNRLMVVIVDLNVVQPEKGVWIKGTTKTAVDDPSCHDVPYSIQGSLNCYAHSLGSLTQTIVKGQQFQANGKPSILDVGRSIIVRYHLGGKHVKNNILINLPNAGSSNVDIKQQVLLVDCCNRCCVCCEMSQSATNKNGKIFTDQPAGCWCRNGFRPVLPITWCCDHDMVGRTHNLSTTNIMVGQSRTPDTWPIDDLKISLRRYHDYWWGTAMRWLMMNCHSNFVWLMIHWR